MWSVTYIPIIIDISRFITFLYNLWSLIQYCIFIYATTVILKMFIKRYFINPKNSKKQSLLDWNTSKSLIVLIFQCYYIYVHICKMVGVYVSRHLCRSKQLLNLKLYAHIDLYKCTYIYMKWHIKYVGFDHL